MFKKLLKLKHKIYINYLYYKDLIKAKVHGFLKKVHRELTYIQWKLTSFKLWISRGIDVANEFIGDLKDSIQLVINALLEDRRYELLNKNNARLSKATIKHGNREYKLKEKLGHL